MARLDTCVTVVDSAEFYSNLDSMKTYEQGETIGTIAELLMEQVEFSNVVVLNKGDLVNEEQTKDIMDKIFLINPRAKMVKTVQSKIDVKNILNTRLFEANGDIKKDFLVEATQTAEKEKEAILAEMEDCCKTSVAKSEKKCCKKKRLLDSGISEVIYSKELC